MLFTRGLRLYLPDPSNVVRRVILYVELFWEVSIRVCNIRWVLFLLFTTIFIRRNLLGKRHIIKHRKLHLGTKYVYMTSLSQQFPCICVEKIYIAFFKPFFGRVVATTITLIFVQCITQEKTYGTETVGINFYPMGLYHFPEVTSVDRTKFEKFPCK